MDNKEIKIKAWSHHAEAMVVDPFFVNGKKVIIDTGKEFMEYETGDSDISLMYGTSCVDKNGDEIFTGHILDCVAFGEYKEKHSIVSNVIICADLQVCVRSKGSTHHGLPLTWGGWESLEIIGNIYQNPELLK